MDIYAQITQFYQHVHAEKIVYGKSLLGRKLYAIKVGDGKPIGLAQYALHAREWITAKLAIYHYQIGVAKGSLWILPLTNPDGALLSQTGIGSVKNPFLRKKLLTVNGGKDFSLWKANARGVDLNVNFDACFGKGMKNIFYPAAENYVGKRPFSEPETRALRKFTLQIQPDYTVSYHTKGEEIYWYFHQPVGVCPRDKALASVLSQTTGYPLCQAKGSAGGYKDWCIQTLKIPSFTVETGQDGFAHPLDENALADIVEKNQFALYNLSKEYTLL